jgi:hypothetical protein
MAVSTRTGRQAGAGQGRFVRSTSTRTGRRYARTASAPRRRTPTQGLRRRRQEPPSGVKKFLTALLPTAAAKKAAPSSKKSKAGGFALVAAAAGMAFKNRDKLGELRRRQNGGTSTTPTGVEGASAPPATPSV